MSEDTPSWIKGLPQGWSYKRLKFIANILNSNVDKKSYEGDTVVRLCNYTDVYYNDFITKDMELMKATATDKEINKFTLKAGDVIITKDSESWDDIAVPACVRENLDGIVCGYHLALLRCKSDAYGVFLFRAMQATGIREQFWVAANGITRYGLGLAGIANALLPLPPLPVQQTITRFLDRKTSAIDALIQARERQIGLLKEKRAALIHRAVTKGLDPNVEMKESGIAWIGKIPKHWDIFPSKRLFEHSKQRATEGDQQLTASQEYGVILQADFMKRAGRQVMQVFLNHEILKHVEKDDFVISMRSFQGGLERSWAQGCISSAYVILRPTVKIHVPFFAYLFKTKGYIQALQATSNLVRDGQALRYTNFCMVYLPILSLEEQATIVTFLESKLIQMDKLAHTVQKSVNTLKEHRQSLITAAVTGKLDIQAMEEALAKPNPIEEAV